MDQGDAAMTRGDMAAALAHYARAESLAPDNHEMVFWHAATLAANGRVEEALPLFAKAYRMWPKWRKLVPRLPKSGRPAADCPYRRGGQKTLAAFSSCLALVLSDA